MSDQSQANTETSEIANPKVKKRGFRVSFRDEVIADWQKIGAAIILFLWCIHRTTVEDLNAETGIREGSIYGGSYRSDSDVAAEIGCHPNTVKLWRSKLDDAGYIRVERGSNGHQYFVLNSCKWPEKPAPIAEADRQETVYQKDKDCLSEQQTLSITEPVSLYDNKKILKPKKDAKTASSQKEGGFANCKTKDFLEFWVLEYEKAYGRKPTLSWGKETRRLGPIFRQHSLETVNAAALSYLADQSTWIEGHGLGNFVGSFDKWLTMATPGNKARPTASAAGGKFDELIVL